MLLSVKLKNGLTSLAEQMGMDITTHLKNITVNGQKRGCSGFVTCGESCVYVTTEHSCYGPISDKSMCRYAKDTEDFSSNGLKNGYNQFVADDFLAAKVIPCSKMAKASPAEGDAGRKEDTREEGLH